MGKLTPPNPAKLLPKNADPHYRGKRKELEKKHGYGYAEPLLLAMLGVGLIWNIEKQVKKREERKDEEEEEERRQRQSRRDGRDRDGRRSETWGGRDGGDDHSRASRDRRSEYGGGRRGSVRGSEYDDGGRGSSRRRRGDREELSRYRDEEEEDDDDGGRYDPLAARRLDPRREEYLGFRDQYRDLRGGERYESRRAGSTRRSSRRDSF